MPGSGKAGCCCGAADGDETARQALAALAEETPGTPPEPAASETPVPTQGLRSRPGGARVANDADGAVASRLKARQLWCCPARTTLT